MLLIPFRSGRNGQNFSYRHENWNKNTLCSTSAQILSGPFRPISGNFSRNEFSSLLSLHAAMFWLFWVPQFLFYLTASNIIKKILQQWAERGVKNREWLLMILLRWITHETSSFTYFHFALCSTKPQRERQGE